MAGSEDEVVERVYRYLVEHMMFGARPLQLAKALNLSEAVVVKALEELERRGRVRLRIPNIEWHRRRR